MKKNSKIRFILELTYTFVRETAIAKFPKPYKTMANQEYYKNGESLVYAPTTLEEERELFTRAQRGDLEARDTIIKNHLLFVANRGRAITKGKIPDDEVISACNAALMEAVDNFDASRGKRFTNYLIPCIRGAVARLWRDRPGWGRGLSESECASISSDVMAYYQDGAAPSPAEIFEEKENDDLLLEALHKARGKLSAKEQELLRQVYIEKLSFAEIARRSKVGRAATHAAHRRIIEKLRGLMKDSNG